MTNINAPFMKKVFNIAKRKGKPDVHHYRKADDFRRGFEIAKWVLFCHARRLVDEQIPIKQFSSDSTAEFIALLMSGKIARNSVICLIL